MLCNGHHLDTGSFDEKGFLIKSASHAWMENRVGSDPLINIYVYTQVHNYTYLRVDKI